MSVGPQHTLPVSHVLTDMVGAYLAVDDAYCELLGRERRELIGQRAVQFTSPAEQAKHEDILTRFRETGAPVDVRKSYLRSDGKLVRVWNKASIVTDGVGPRRMMASVQLLPDTTPISPVERNYAAAGGILRSRRERAFLFDTRRFSEQKWDIALTCYRLECSAQSRTVANICDELRLDLPAGSLAILEMITCGDLDIEHVGVGIVDTAIRISVTLQNDLSNYLSGCDAAFRCLIPDGMSDVF